MKVRLRLVLLFVLALPAAARAAVPLDDAGFTAYLQQKLQLYATVPVTVAGPLGIHVAVAADNVVDVSLHDLHDECVRAPAQCDDIVRSFVQNAARTVLSDAPPAAATITSAGSTTVPGERAGFMAYVAGKAASLMPEAKIEVDGMNLAVTRPGGHRLLLQQQALFDKCKAADFRCSIAVDTYLGGMREWLALPRLQDLRIAPNATLRCLPQGCAGPLDAFGRLAFANLAEVCFKGAPKDGVVWVTNADREDLDLGTAAALDLCKQNTRAALGLLAVPPPAPDGIGTIVGPYAASYALFPDAWSSLAADGHLLVAVPSRDNLLYIKGDSEAQVAALGARALAVFRASGLAVSSDVYRWDGGGFVLATARSTMAAVP